MSKGIVKFNKIIYIINLLALAGGILGFSYIVIF